MFIWSKEKLKDIIRKVLNEEYILKSCEVCGCLIEPWVAVKGESVIKKKGRYLSLYDSSIQTILKEPLIEEYIVTPYYCKVHAPKKEEKIPEQPPIPNESKTTEHVMWKVADYSKQFRSCGGQWNWKRGECNNCIHYDATEFEKYKENIAKGIEDNCQYITRCRYKRVGYWVKDE